MSPAKPARCPWPGVDDPVYAAYHDTEWGRPQMESRVLFEKLTLEAFQSGLSWLTILKKRDGFRRAFANFEVEAIARFDNADVARLMADTGIVRNQAKIRATIANAQATRAMSKSQSFSAYLWSFADAAPTAPPRQTCADVPSITDTSKRLAKDLKARGFSFVGPTTVYALMQAMGMVNDHLTTCPQHGVCADAQRAAAKQRHRASTVEPT